MDQTFTPAGSVLDAPRTTRPGYESFARSRDARETPCQTPRPQSVLRPEELEALAALGAIRTFRKQTVIFSEGDENDSFYLVLSGRVKVFVSDENGREIVLADRGPSEYFGETLLDEGPRVASVMTLASSRIAIVDKPRFLGFLAGHPRIAIRLMQDLAHRVRILTQKIKTVALMDVEDRVMRFLGELSAMHGSTVIERAPQQEIASRVGASREMVSRVMTRLAAQGCISIDRKHITLTGHFPSMS